MFGKNEWRSKESSTEGTHDSASAQKTPAGGRNEDKLAQGYKNTACIGRDGIEKATVTGRGHQRQQELPALYQQLRKKRNEGNTGLLLTVAGVPVAVNVDNTVALDPFSALVFAIRVF